jgi:hypothetical protein
MNGNQEAPAVDNEAPTLRGRVNVPPTPAPPAD